MVAPAPSAPVLLLALGALAPLPPEEQLACAVERLRGVADGPQSGAGRRERAGRASRRRRPAGERGSAPLADFTIGDERDPRPDRLDGRLLEAVCRRALGGARGAVFTPVAEARLLAAFGLAQAAAMRRRGVEPADVVAALLGATGGGEDRRRAIVDALDGLRVLDFACGGGALLAAAEILAQRVGARLELLGGDVSPLAVRATAARLELLGASCSLRIADALEQPWPRAELVLANPPFLRHEALPAATKAAAVRASGLSRQADLSAHLAALAIRAAPVAALVLPRALDTSRSAAPWREDARARGGFVLRLRSACAGSFAANVDTRLAVWVAGARDLPDVEAAAPLDAITVASAVALARRGVAGRDGACDGGEGTRPDAEGTGCGDATGCDAVEGRRAGRDGGGGVGRRGAADRGVNGGACSPVRVGDVAEVRFGMKSGANAFFHLAPLGGGRFRSAIAGEVELADADVAPLLASLKQARAPEWADATGVLFRPREESAAAREYVALGEALGISRRPTCASRRPWWRIAPGRAIAPVLYPAKIGARAFAFLNSDGYCEDKKWHALFPRVGPDALEPWLLATVLGATPVRLAIDLAARQLTGAQAIADVDCGVLAGAPFPAPRAVRAVRSELERCRDALARDAVTTDLAAMLERPAQRELDAIVGRALGMSAAAVARSRGDLVARVGARLAHSTHVRQVIRCDRTTATLATPLRPLAGAAARPERNGGGASGVPKPGTPVVRPDGRAPRRPSKEPRTP